MPGDKKPALEPAIIVIFGITGDLAQRKLLPALYHLIKDDLLHEHTKIVGVTRQNVTAESLLDNTELCVNEEDGICDPVALKKMHAIVSMFQIDLVKGEDYDRLHEYLDQIEDEHAVHMNRLYYLSIPPQVIGTIVRLLGKHGLNASCQHGAAVTRLLIEKPFGYDLKSAEELIADTTKYFGEDQIFRIDHYVAKETVQNILTFRFNNPLFDMVWDAEHISSIQITATEKIGIEGRVTFYEETGALRDLIQSHLLQLLAILTMERPKIMDAPSVHAAKLDLLNDVEPVPSDQIADRTVRGQYDTYRKEVNNDDSITETFAALKLDINNKRWKNVPILIQTGKALKEKLIQLCVIFKDENNEQPNLLRFNIQPNEGIMINLQVKKPGFSYETQDVPMNFNYQQTFNDHGHPDAYERVLVDAVRGDHTLFATGDEVMAAWRIVEPVVQAWAKNGDHLETYATGSWGPKSIENMASNLNSAWVHKK